MSFAVLFVCTGNICRSPMAERLFLARALPGAAVVASSAGTAGLTGHAMDAPSALALRELGVDAHGHVAQRLTPGLVAAADLVLTAQQAHRDAVMAVERACADRVFTLREFGRLASGLPAPASADGHVLRARVATVAAVRSPAPRRLDDIGDPFGAPLSQVRACAAQVSEAVDSVLAGLGLAVPGEASA